MSSKIHHPCKEEVLFSAISYENIVVAFLILPFGIGIALLILIIERVSITNA
jgi:hypothetical protein